MGVSQAHFVDWEASEALRTTRRRFHAMVKPIGSACNLDCQYCYYLSKQNLLDHRSGERMADDLLDEFIRQYIEGQDGDRVVFSWQGGEPTLLGLDFLRKVVELEEKHRKPHQRIENDLQTNGTLLDEEWCRFLRRHCFLVGLSIDGPRNLHDAYRVTKGGEPTFNKVFAAAKLLRKHGVKFNTLTVVNRLNVKRPLDVYRFLTREIGSTYVQLIPCVEPKEFRTVAPQHWNPAALPVMGTPGARPGSPDSIVTDWSVDPDDYGSFLCKVFDEWHSKDLGRVLVDLFETAVAQWMGFPAQRCVTGEFCGKGVALEHDGRVYSCDHYVYPEYCLGDIHVRPISEMVLSRRQMEFGFAKRDTLPQYCRECEYLSACWGECPKNRFIKTPDGQPGLNYLCSGLKRFFEHADPYIERIVKQLKRE
ncbi:MAG: anaerobic sulfatase maturase [Planctomycetaceae bacterium]|nr:anaerobic sulfatase maturase [Planctomycetaceae bacterium]